VSTGKLSGHNPLLGQARRQDDFAIRLLLTTRCQLAHRRPDLDLPPRDGFDIDTNAGGFQDQSPMNGCNVKLYAKTDVE
jgi:hypothetical protein